MARGGVGSLGSGIGEIGRLTELRRRIFFLLGAIVVFRIGAFIPVPGIDPNQLQALFDSQAGTILDIFNMLPVGALARFSIFALNALPYNAAPIRMHPITR